jgi:hypothetical protein
MLDRPFLDQTNPPSEQALQAALGNAYPCCQKVLALANRYSQTWAFSKSSGWMLKISDRKKALLYILPLNAGFKISLTLRENEREVFVNNEELGSLRKMISSAKKYPEGFALQFDIVLQDDFQPVELLLIKLITLRA